MQFAKYGWVTAGVFAVLLLAFCPNPVLADDDDAPLISDYMGICGHTVLFDEELFSSVVSQVRDYHHLSWDTGSSSTSNETIFPWNCNYWINWETLYGSWVEQGFTIDVSVMFSDFEEEDWDNVAADAYAYGYALASYFGPTYGNGLISSIEIGNEVGYYSDDFFAILFESMAQGIQDADSNVLIATPSVTIGESTDYYLSLSAIQDSIDLADVITVHTYPYVETWPSYEVAYPESDEISYLQDVLDVIAWRDEYAPDAEIWVTEFGYDTVSDDEYEAGTYAVTETMQAQYLVRSYLLFSAMDVEKAYVYYFYDSGDWIHGTSGLITEDGECKASYWAVTHMQETLGDYQFSSVIEETSGELYIYAYEHGEDSDDVIWVLWSPTGEDRQAEVTIDLLGATVLWAEEMALTEDGSETVSYEILDDGTIRLIVGESPIYLGLSYATAPEPTSTGLLLVGLVALLRKSRRNASA